jgi:peptidyl-prolyl cis-trans isomerase D
MFDFVRNHTRWVLGFILLLIIPSFVFFGVEGYTKFMDGSGAAVAKVDGRSVTRQEWEMTHQRQVERVRREQPTVDAKLLDTPEFKRETLDQMLRDRVLRAAAQNLHLTPENARVQRLFRADPSMGDLRNADGTVNQALLTAQGMNSQIFLERLRADYAANQVLGGVAGSALAGPAVAGQALDALLQRRVVDLQFFPAAALRAKMNPSDADLEAYFKANEAKFRAPEQASIEYVVLDLEALSRDLAVPEEDLRKYYAENASRYSVAEERRASHILVKTDAAWPAGEKQKAKERAEALLAQLRKNPAQFAELARKNSEDPGSAVNGGDLDFFGRNAMVKPFEDAAYAMKQGEISNLVESEFGFHIIQLTGIRGGDKQPFESVRAEIEAEVRKSLAQRRYAEAAEQFTNTVYEQSDSLQPVVDKLKLAKRIASVTRTPAPGATGPLANARLLTALFSSDSIANKRNTDAIEVGPNQLVSARIVKHEPARSRPLAEVRDAVREAVVTQQAAAQARQDARARVATIQAKPDEALETTLTVSRARSEGLPRPVLDAVLKADAAKLPLVKAVDLDDLGSIVVRVKQVLPREPQPGGEAQVVAQFGQAFAGAEAEAYLAALKKRLKAEVRESTVASVMAAASGPAR